MEVLVNQVVRQEALISENRKPQLRKLIYKLIEKIESHENQNFYLFKILRACAADAFAGALPPVCALLPAPTPPPPPRVRRHILPLTNCAFNKSGDRFITGSYDRTAGRSEQWPAALLLQPP